MVEIFIQGNLVKDVEVREGKNGNKYATIKVASNGFSKGEKRTDYYDCMWFNYKENIIEYLKKGKPVTVVGEFYPSAMVGRDGKAYTNNDVVVHNVTFLDVTRGEDKNANIASGSLNRTVPPTVDANYNGGVEEMSPNLPTGEERAVEEPEDNDLPF